MPILPNIRIEARGKSSAETLSALTKIAYAGILYFLAFVLDATLFFAAYNVISYILGVGFLISLVCLTCDVTFVQGIHSQLVRNFSWLQGSSTRMQCLVPVLSMSGAQTIGDLVTIGIPLLQGVYSLGGLKIDALAIVFLVGKLVIIMCYLTIAWHAYEILSRVETPASEATDLIMVKTMLENARGVLRNFLNKLFQLYWGSKFRILIEDTLDVLVGEYEDSESYSSESEEEWELMPPRSWPNVRPFDCAIDPRFPETHQPRRKNYLAPAPKPPVFRKAIIGIK